MKRVIGWMMVGAMLFGLAARIPMLPAQGDATITPETANLLSEQATIDLGATTTYLPVWSAQSDLLAIPVGAGGTQLIDMATLSVMGTFPVITEGAEAVSAALNPDGGALVTG